MSNFPYNHHKYSQAETINGCPFTYKQAKALAYEIRLWHGEMETDDWSQSYAGGEIDTTYLALGLMEMLSDPGAVNRLISTGENVKKKLDTLMNGSSQGLPDFFINAKQIIKDLFNEDTKE